MSRPSPRRPLRYRLHDYFFPHRRNGYRPHLFGWTSLATIGIGVLVLEGAYLAQVKLVFPHTNFLAAVLPGTLVALTNENRATYDAPAVTESARLDQAAMLAAQDMASKGYFAHVSPSGVTPWDWLDKVGYRYSYAGENLAVDFTDSSAVEKAWMASPTHQANIVKPQYTQVGIGVANGSYQGKQTTFVVQFFATPAVTLATPQPTATQALSKVPTPSVILGTQVVPAVSNIPTPKAPSLFDRVTTSPTHSVFLVLGTLAGVLIVLLLVAVTVRWRIQYLEVVGGGFALLVALLALMVFTVQVGSGVRVLSNAQSPAAEVHSVTKHAAARAVL